MIKTNDEDKDMSIQAAEFLSSVRGQYIMGQALHIAIEALESVEPPTMREYSNIADMKFIRDNVFPMGSAIAAARKIAKEKLEVKHGHR